MKKTSWITPLDLEIMKMFDAHKLSVSSVKYSRGHDADSMEANLKVGTKIVGTVWDDSWGGENQYDGKNVNEFLSLLDIIIKEAGPYTFLGSTTDHSYDTLMELLIAHTKNKRDCKNKTVILIGKTEPTEDNNSLWGTKTYTYKTKYDPKQDTFLLNDFSHEEKQGFNFIEILNQRYI